MINILVFPCGSEVALEIYRSLKYSSHIDLLGGNSKDDHGKFVYKKYIGNIPFIDTTEIVPALKEIVFKYNIDAIYPATDKVLYILKKYENELGCKIISSKLETTAICLSKSKTYNSLKDIINVPKLYKSIAEIDQYPVFFKPDIGYGSRGIYVAEDAEKAASFYKINQLANNEMLMMEFLPGKEYTVDCFTDRNGKLRFSAGRKRNRIMNGISVNTLPEDERKEEFILMANKINTTLELQGAWFFQVRENERGELVLLEVASRLGGSSALYRNLGVNFALLSVFDAFGFDVEVILNDMKIELDRAFSNRYKIDFEYEEVYVDFDDCLIIRGRVNVELIAFLYQSINDHKRLILITRHAYIIKDTLIKYRLDCLFDEVVHLKKEDEKYKYIKNTKAIFIDDSFAERKKIKENIDIPVFAPDMIECLMN